MVAAIRRSCWLLLTLVGVGCGARSGLDLGASGGDGAGAGGGGSPQPVDPDIECPVTCQVGACAPVVLVDETPIGWHAVEGGELFYTTAWPEGGNALIRMPICGGEKQVLLEREQFAGYGVIVGDDVVIPAALPAAEVLRLPKVGGRANVVYAHPAGDAYITRAVSQSGGVIVLSTYSFDGGLVLLALGGGTKPEALNGNLPDPDFFWDGRVLPSFLPNLPILDASDGPPDVSGYIGSSLGVSEFTTPGVFPSEPYILSSERRVAGPLIAEGAPFPTFYFSAADDPINGEDGAHIRLEYEPEPILPDQSGLILAFAEGVLYGSSRRFDEETVWRALDTDAAGTQLFRSAQVVFDLFVRGKSVYARTEQRIVRIGTSCPSDTSPCFILDE